MPRRCSAHPSSSPALARSPFPMTAPLCWAPREEQGTVTEYTAGAAGPWGAGDHPTQHPDQEITTWLFALRLRQPFQGTEGMCFQVSYPNQIMNVLSTEFIAVSPLRLIDTSIHSASNHTASKPTCIYFSARQLGADPRPTSFKLSIPQ